MKAQCTPVKQFAGGIKVVRPVQMTLVASLGMNVSKVALLSIALPGNNKNRPPKPATLADQSF
jgi:hypothetical protein